MNAIKGNASRSGDENDEVDDADSSFENSRRKKLKGNKNAEKTTRMIELSCYHLGEVTVESLNHQDLLNHQSHIPATEF